MVRPKWIIGLLFALALAAAFAALGQWQLQRAIQSGEVVEHPTETVIPLGKAVRPGDGLASAMVGQLVTVRGVLSDHDFVILNGRVNNPEDNGPAGYWVTGRMTVEGPDGQPAALAVALGFTTDRAAAQKAVAALRAEHQSPRTMTARLLPTEAPIQPPNGANPMQMQAMSVAALINVWPDLGDMAVYEAYVVSHAAPPHGLQAIYSPPPIEAATIDWLNVFYAAEWAVFAGFAVFLWYRVVRDAWERECEDLLDEAEGAEGRAAATPAPETVEDTEKVD